MNNEELLQNKWEYLRLWFRKGWQYPGCYLRAFLDNTYQAWYPGTSVVDDPDGDIYYFDFEGRNVLEMKTISSRLTEFYRKISLEYYYQKIPVIRALFAIGTYFWLAVILFFYGIRRRRAEIWNSLAAGSRTVPYGLSGSHIPGALLSAFILCSSGRYLLISR